MPTPRPDSASCPCQSGVAFGECCAPLHRGETEAPTAVRLMRSRYAAFVTGDAAYLLRSWHRSTRPASLELEPGIRWFRLDIEATTDGGLLDTTGTVTFAAHYKADGERGVQRERSLFVRERGAWFYVDGVADPAR